MDEAASAAKARAWRVILLLMGLCFISHLNRVSIAIAADEKILPQGSISPQQMGVVYTAFLLFYSVAMIPAGILIDRVGPAASLAIMGIGSGILAALTGMAGLALATGTQLWISWLVIRSVMGLVTTPLHPASAHAISLWIPQTRQTLVNGLVTGAALLGIASSYHLFGSLIDWFDWPAAFMITGAGTVVLAVVWHFQARLWPFSKTTQTPGEAARRAAIANSQSPPANKAAVERSAAIPLQRRSLFRNKSLWFLTLSYAAIGYFQYLFFYWIHYYFEHVLKLGKSESRDFATLPTLAMALSMPLGGWIADRVARAHPNSRAKRVVPIAGMSSGAIFLIFGLWAQRPGWILVWFTLSLAAVGLSEGPFWRTVIELGRAQAGTAAAIMNTGGNAVGLLAPWLTPVVSARYGWHWGLFLGALVAFLGALCWFGVTAPTKGGEEK